MEPIFENSYTLTKNVYYEINKNGWIKLSRVFGLALSIMILSLSVLSIVIFWDWHYPLFFFVWAAVLFYISVGNQMLIMRHNYKCLLLENRGLEVAIHTLFSEHIQVHQTNKSETTFAYSQITKIWETKHMIILKIKNLLYVPIKKDSFINGECNDFKQLIKEKCSKAKIKIKKK